MEIRPVGVELFHADGQTDFMTLIVTFLNFARGPKIGTYSCLMLSNFFRRSADHKQRVNKKQSVEIDRSASSGGQKKPMKWVSFSCPLLEHTNFYGAK